MSSFDDLYQQVILDHSRERHGSGLVGGAAAQSHQINPTCGDELTLELHVDAVTRVVHVRWEGSGCAISMASASLLTDLVAGTDIVGLSPRIQAFRAMLRSRGEDQGDEELLGDAVVLSGVSRYIARVKCAMLAWVALEAALTRVNN
jgi:nitrogen fixation NifU-like protein